jgi:hypothetical protein
MVWWPLSAAGQVQELVITQLRPITKSSQQLNALRRSEWLAELAWQSLIAEAELTPKPGLVDGRGSGSHSDLSLDLMRRSADAITPYFTRMALASADAQMDPACVQRLPVLVEKPKRRCFARLPAAMRTKVQSGF